MRIVKLVVEYDGADFCGWQVQPGLRTAQGEMEKALLRLTGEKVSAVASGRTDSGVHAWGQVVGVRTSSSLAPDVFVNGLNALLPGDISVLSAEDAAADFHPIRDARGKWYRYIILERRERSSIDRGRVWLVRRRLDINAMREASACLIGVHDFQSFRSSTCDSKDSVKNMKKIDIFRDGKDHVIIDFRASGFLKQMARAITGSLAEVGSGKREPSEIAEILKARDRSRAGVTAPAHGLYLVMVEY